MTKGPLGAVMPRRRFLQQGAVWAVPAVISVGACAGDEEAAPSGWNDGRTAAADEVVFGVYPRTVVDGEEAVRAACNSLEWSWLGSGDSVLVKIGSNSGNEHPAVTSPSALRAVVGELYERGAGRVIVGEQSGVEAVRLTEGDVRYSSTRELLEGNGLLQAIEDAGGEALFFDDGSYADGYFEATLPEGSHWSRPMYVANVVKEVDHIVYLPRLSSHLLAGSTHGLKLAVGFLRDDSRNHLHHDAVSFYEKYAEISYVEEIRARLRLTLTLAEQVLLHFGPDTGTVFELEQRVVLASQNIANHDALAAAVLQHMSEIVDPAPGLVYDAGLVDGANQLFVNTLVPTVTGLPWTPPDAGEYTNVIPHEFEKGLAHDRPLARAWELTGGRPKSVDALVVAEQPDGDLAQSIDAHTEGTFALV